MFNDWGPTWTPSGIQWTEYGATVTWLRGRYPLRIAKEDATEKYYITARSIEFFGKFEANRIGPFDTMQDAIDAADMMIEQGIDPFKE